MTARGGRLVPVVVALGVTLPLLLVGLRCASRRPPPPRLLFPVEGAEREGLKNGFRERRGWIRRHEALDIAAPRRTPVRAVADGVVVRLRTSPAGGRSLEQMDAAGRHCYYYAHLEAYAANMQPGQRVQRGDVVAYVGSSGNAPEHFPHLHFAVFEVAEPGPTCWTGTPIDPYPLFD